MANHSRVADLLSYWRERYASGKELTPEELCQHDPELLEVVRQELRSRETGQGTLALNTSLALRPADSPSTIDVTGGLTSTAPPEVSPREVSPGLASSPHLPSISGYDVTGEIARGGMGCVYAALDPVLEREVAIKTLLPGAKADRFVTEAKITARLPHPNIPPVYALGTMADGSPYLVMKRVRGQTLAELLKGRATAQDDWPRLMQVFEQIAQAVGFAHARGVIHRDLKPQNVMVGEFGEVQVMDWGLAKDQAAHERDLGDNQVQADSQQTLAGTVLGTPGYMAPEQARGEPVEARADVFALGAVLAAILTGKPAFVAASPRETILLAAREDLDGVLERLHVSGADAELIALAKRCLSPAVSRRPANGHVVAMEVAAYRAGVESRLRQAETERAQAVVRELEQRQRRRQLTVAAGLVALVLLAGLGASLWQMNVAQRERDAKDTALTAEKRAREQAFAALRSITDEVVERRIAAGEGTRLSDDDRAFLRGIVNQFEAFAAIQGDDADSRAIRAEGRARVGLIRQTLGESTAAEADYTAAIELRIPLAAELPERQEIRQELARTYLNRGKLRSDAGRFEEAQADYEAAAKFQQRLIAEFPANPNYRGDLAMTHNNRGIVLEGLGQLEEAKAAYNAAIALQQELAADEPADAEFRQDLAQSYNNRGVLWNDLGQTAEAESDYRAALDLQQQLVVDFPSHPEYRKDLAQSHNNRAALRQTTDRLTEALADHDAAQRLYRQLAAEFPARPEFRRDLAMSHANRGVLLKESNRLQEAEADYDAALEIRKQLTSDFPGRSEFREDLASSYMNRGLLLSETDRPDEAQADYDASLAIQKQLAGEFASQPDFRNRYAGACVNLALLQLQSKRFSEAQRLLLEGREHHLAALQANPRHPTYRQFYRNHLGVLTAAYAGQLKQEDAIRTAEARRDVGWDPPEDACDAASYLSQCLTIVARHEKLDEQQRRDAVRFYGDEGLRLLQEAVSRGFRDVNRVQQDPAFRVLLLRKDVQQLLAGLEELRE